MLILSFPKYSSAGATLQRGAALDTAFGAGWLVFGAGFGAGAVAESAAVVAAATSETHTTSRFNATSLIVCLCLCAFASAGKSPNARIGDVIS
jgi:hypothetical protein